MENNSYGINSSKMQKLISEIEYVNDKMQKTLNQISEQVEKTTGEFDMPSGDEFRSHHKNLETYYSQIQNNMIYYADNLRLILQMYNENNDHNADIFQNADEREE